MYITYKTDTEHTIKVALSNTLKVIAKLLRHKIQIVSVRSA